MMTQREHVYGLAAANGIKVNERPIEWGESVANWKEREITVARLDCDEAYAGALHELGHLIAPGGNLRKNEVRPKNELENAGYVLHEEATAWTWAKANALGWNATMQRVMTDAFATYEKPAEVLRETERLEAAAKFLPTPKPYAKGAAASFFRTGGRYGAPQAAGRKPVVDLNATPLTPEAVERKELMKMFEALFGGGPGPTGI